MPQVSSSFDHESRARGPVYSAFDFVQISMLPGTYSG